MKCDACGEILYRADLEKTLNVCPACDHHMPWPARARLAGLLDPGSFDETDADLEPTDPLGFADSKKYRDRLKATRKALGENDAFVSGVGTLDGVTRSRSARSSSSSWAARWARWWARR